MSVSHSLRQSSADPRLDLLLKICEVKDAFRNQDKQTLRDIASVVGGDPNHEAAFTVQVQSWLKDFRSALSKVALSAGFRSTGLTAALTHPSFIHSTDGVSNGIIFDELTDFSDPTGVLAGPVTVITEKVEALTSVSGAPSKSALRSSNFSKKSALENELSGPAADSTRNYIGRQTVYGSDVTRDAAVPTSYTLFADTQPNLITTNSAKRTTFVGPRLVLSNVKKTSDTTIEVEGGMSELILAGSAANTTLACSRFVVVGKRSATEGAGSVGGTSELIIAGDSIIGSNSDALCTNISDTDMSKLQAGPTVIGTTTAVPTGVASANYLKADSMPGSSGYYGLSGGDIVMIPVSGLDDVSTMIRGSDDVRKTVMEDSVTNADAVASQTSFSLNDNKKDRLSLNRYIKLAERTKPGTVFDTVMVLDLTSLITTSDVAVDGTADVVSVHRHCLVGEVYKRAPREQLQSIVASPTITENVETLRKAWFQSNIVRAVDGYDDFAREIGEEAIVDRAMSELVSGAWRNTGYIVSDEFFQSLQNMSILAATANDDTKFETLKDASTMSLFTDPMDANMWIGPDNAASRMRVLTRDGKNALFKKWSRVMDYLALITKMNIDYSDRM